VNSSIYGNGRCELLALRCRGPFHDDRDIPIRNTPTEDHLVADIWINNGRDDNCQCTDRYLSQVSRIPPSKVDCTSQGPLVASSLVKDKEKTDLRPAPCFVIFSIAAPTLTV
jgi:hypothetical protein